MTSTALPSLLTVLRAEWATYWVDQPLQLGALGGDTAGGWAARVRGCAGRQQDEMLAALIAAAADGEQAAERTLLHVLVPAVDRAASAAGLLRDQKSADRPGLVVAAVWETVRVTASTAIARHAFITLRRASIARLAPRMPEGQRQLESATEAVDPSVLVALAGANREISVPAEVRLAGLLDVAVRRRVITHHEVDLLQRVHLQGCAAVDVAAESAIAPGTLRKRVHRVTQRLRAAVETGVL